MHIKWGKPQCLREHTAAPQNGSSTDSIENWDQEHVEMRPESKVPNKPAW